MKLETVRDMRQLLLNKKRIFLFGAGVCGHILAEYCKYNLQIEVKGVLVSDISNNPCFLLGIPVMNMKDVLDKNLTVIIATKEESQYEINILLKQQGFVNVVMLSNEVLTQIEENERINLQLGKYNRPNRYIAPYLTTLIPAYDVLSGRGSINLSQILEDDKLYLSRLVICLGTKCSLRCRECNNLMPYFENAKDLNLEIILKSVERILQLSESVLRCELIGGEPFVSKNLLPVIQYIIESDKIKQIEITTNATIIPRNEELIRLLKNSKVLVQISDYGTRVDKNKVIDFCSENGIRYRIRNSGKWVSSGGVEKRNKDIATLKKEYRNCYAGYVCKTLYEDKLFQCARAASLFALGFMKEKDYLLIDEKLKAENVRQFLLRDYSQACDYCDYGREDIIYVEPAEQC